MMADSCCSRCTFKATIPSPPPRFFVLSAKCSYALLTRPSSPPLSDADHHHPGAHLHHGARGQQPRHLHEGGAAGAQPLEDARGERSVSEGGDHSLNFSLKNLQSQSPFSTPSSSLSEPYTPCCPSPTLRHPAATSTQVYTQESLKVGFSLALSPNASQKTTYEQYIKLMYK